MKKKIILFLILIIFVVIFLFIVGSLLTFYIFKWLNKNIDTKLYFKSYKKKCKTVLEKYGDMKIKKIYLIKNPVSRFFLIIINLITFNLLAKYLKKYKLSLKDKNFLIMHTRLLVEIELKNKLRKIILIEKCNGIEVTSNFRIYENEDIMKIKFKNKNKLTINKLLNLTKSKMGEKKFYNWNLYENNCQKFIIKILESLNINNKTYKKFIYQKKFTDSIILPESIKYLINGMVNIASLIESIYYDCTL